MTAEGDRSSSGLFLGQSMPLLNIGGRAPNRAFRPSIHAYPERPEDELTGLDRKVYAGAARLFGRGGPHLRLSVRLRAHGIWRRALTLEKLSDAALKDCLEKARSRAISEGLRGSAGSDLMAVVCEVASRTLGMKPYKVQIRASLVILESCVAEMATGEGKSLVASLTAAMAALTRVPAHVVTVSDYLATRDADEMRPLFDWLGLSLGCITHETPQSGRSGIYGCDVVYASNKEFTFDYLRDRLRMGDENGPLRLKLARFMANEEGAPGPMMRGLFFAIVDEADSVLIDEARTPLILSQQTDAQAERQWAQSAAMLAKRSRPDTDYRVIYRERRIELTEGGKERLDWLTRNMGPEWRIRAQREQAVRQALSAELFFHKGDQYVVQDGKVVIVDEYTGRLMPERSWNDGLHQLVELKEDVEVTSRKVAIARNTYQRFFSRYIRLGGMTGTAREIRKEIASVYRIGTIRIPTRLPLRRKRLPTRLLRTEEKKLAFLAGRVAALQAEGRAVLIGTRTVAASERISTALTEAGIAHNVLNALHDAEEADIIKGAGEPGRTTVATNMAGRGVHIPVSQTVLAGGGLHVMLTELHDSSRIDRQLMGRTARQGQPGSFEAVLALDDPLLAQTFAPLLRTLAWLPGSLGKWAGLMIFRRAQRAAERRNAQARRSLLKLDEHLQSMMAFSGRPE
ncbi:MAG: prepilin peptidase [Pseudomonadota bacterium]